MYHKIFNKLDDVLHFKTVSAHCDIPCGIYDPHLAQLSALTVIRMLDLMTDLQNTHKDTDLEFRNSMIRFVTVKEEHAELCKKEIRVIFGDYIKKDHIDKFPELPELTHKIMQVASKSRQTAARENGLELLGLVNRFAEIFWETKGIATKKAVAPYKPSEEVVYPVL
jgi:nickel superoxide dismutase